MFNLSYTILTRNLVHGLQFKKKKNNKKQTAICFISTYYKCIKKILHQMLLMAAEP